MKVKLITAPIIEPVSLAEAKVHCKVDSGSFADNVDELQSLVPDEYAIAADYTTHVGTGVEVLGYTALVILNSGTNQATGTVDCKIQESDDDVTYTDWTGGAFTQVTTANDNAIQEIAYTGTKRYIRTVAQVLLAACEFGTTIIRLTGDATDDSLLTDIIVTARQYVENITRRALLTQIWDYYLPGFPSENYIRLHFGNLQSNIKATGTFTSSGVNVSLNDTVTIGTKTYRFLNWPTIEGDVDIGATAADSLENLKNAIMHTGTPGVDYVCANAHPTVEVTDKTDTVLTLQSILGGVQGNLIALSTTAATLTASGATLTGGITGAEIKYYDSDGLADTLTVIDDYIMEFNGQGCGRLVLPYGKTWPSFTPYPSNPIVIRFTCGWTAAALVPSAIKSAILLICADLYEQRGDPVLGLTGGLRKQILKI